jgi:hypothetical protein
MANQSGPTGPTILTVSQAEALIVNQSVEGTAKPQELLGLLANAPATDTVQQIAARAANVPVEFATTAQGSRARTARGH